jgi:cell division protein ZapA
MQKNKIVASIAGRDYPLSGIESEEYIHRVAIYVDRKIQ